MADTEHKALVNYRFPDECCFNCKRAYRNGYGDCQCAALPTGNTVDMGAVCDLYDRADKDMLGVDRNEHSRSRVVDFDNIIKTPGRKVNCADCVYSYSDSSGRPLCVMSGSVIKDIMQGCRKYEKGEVENAELHSDVGVDYVDDRGISSGSSTYDSGSSETVGEDNGPVEAAVDEEGIAFEIPENANCCNCRFSSTDDDGKPYCTSDGMLLDNTDGVCDSWWDGMKTCANCTYSAMVDGQAVCMLHHEGIVSDDWCYQWKGE